MSKFSDKILSAQLFRNSAIKTILQSLDDVVMSPKHRDSLKVRLNAFWELAFSCGKEIGTISGYQMAKDNEPLYPYKEVHVNSNKRKAKRKVVKKPDPKRIRNEQGEVKAVYECKYHEPAQGEDWSFCHAPHSNSNTCECGKYLYTLQFCPFFKRGKLRGKWGITKFEIDDALDFVQELRHDD